MTSTPFRKYLYPGRGYFRCATDSRRRAVYLALAMMLCVAARGRAQIRTVSGRVLESVPVAITATHVECADGYRLPIDAFWSYDRRPADQAADAAALLEFDFGVLYGSDVEVQDGVVTLSLGGRPVTLPLDALRLVQVDRKIEAPGRESFLQASTTRGERDVLVASTPKGAVLAVEGEFLGMDTEQVHFFFKGQSRSLPRGRVTGIVRRAGGTPATGLYRVRFRDGSSVRSPDVTLRTDGMLELTLAGDTCSVRWDHVCSVKRQSGRVVLLVGLAPDRAVVDAGVGIRLPWRRNTTTMGGTMRLGGAPVVNGIATHGSTRLLYSVPPGQHGFVATVGLDDVLGARGDCRALVRDGTGAALWEQRLVGGAAPVDIRLALDGVSAIDLVVQAGENFDLGDHVNWVEARFTPGSVDGERE